MINKKFQLTNDKEKHSVEYVKRLEEIIALNQSHINKRAEAAAKIIELEEKLNAINGECILESDQNELEKIAADRMAIKLEVETLKMIQHSDVRNAIRQKFEDLEDQPCAIEAEKEYKEYYQLLNNEIERVRTEADQTIKELEALINSHTYRKKERLTNAIIWSVRK